VRAEDGDPLGSVVRQSLGDSRPDCPQADLLAAYADRALDAAGAAEVEQHLSSCQRCREVLLFMTRAAEAEAAEPTDATGAADVRPLRPTGWLHRWPWLAGAAAAGLAVVLWTASRPEVERLPADTLKQALPEARGDRELKSPSSPAEPPKPGAPQAGDKIGRAAVPPRDLAKEKAEPPERRQAQRDAKVSARVAEEIVVADKRERKAPASPSPNPNAAPAETAARAEGFLARTAPLEAASPDGRVRWRIDGDGYVRRSDDGGATWQTVKTEFSAAGARAIAAPTPLGATITTADGRRFTTADGGKTWQEVGGRK
jgi:Putative zinc-finger